MSKPQKITPFLWFDHQAEEAAGFYTSVFRNSKIDRVLHFGEQVGVVDFSLDGQGFNAMNAGPAFQLNPTISFFVVCETEAETDEVWGKLLEGGKVLVRLDKYPWSEKYGWVQDRYGLSWQISLGKMEDTGQKFTPSLLFSGVQSGRAEEALHFYASVFSPSSITGILHYGAGGEGREGTVNHAQFSLCGQTFMAMDDTMESPDSFNEALSFVVDCEDQKEVDYFWDSLLAGGGQESMCGWLKDRFGVSWQVIPRALPKLLSDPDPEKAQRASAAMMKMRKIEVDKLV
ncbi:MAG: VOC family protein [Saprospirales bacterium]|nr:VOC family protein [Saprospirales bacterium]